MVIPTIIIFLLSLIFTFIAYKKGVHIQGFKNSFNLLIQVIPILIFAFILAGMIQVIIPKETLSKFIGAEAGLRGILVGTIAGTLTPGGPVIVFPIAAGFLKAGASMGTVVSFITAWALLAVTRMPLELGIIGWKFLILRVISVFIFPPIAGITAEIISKFFHFG